MYNVADCSVPDIVYGASLDVRPLMLIHPLVTHNCDNNIRICNQRQWLNLIFIEDSIVLELLYLTQIIIVGWRIC